ncbi:MAG TPA: DNA repair protein RecO [Povalibacter sp.]|uniref:DNA repair protein RecO n=1 Tax=Povalibacter sp. TaxID=1962978 RepID=UPI002CE9A9B2|nr:DNA repair protein RecO [Povalibacter sp.]HMN44826.1 DNA repair protein RecO [Povalibacter sp.]
MSTRLIQLQPAYVLHHRPYRDTSRILELFTRDHGRVTVFARGARGSSKKGASSMSMLQPFNRLLVSWSAGAEAGTLTAVEFDGTYRLLQADRLVSGYYLNELLLKLFARHDAHADVFALYAHTLEVLKASGSPLAPLRVFEKRLLEALGYGLPLTHDVAGVPIDADRAYRYRFEQGAIAASDVAEGPSIYSGAVLLALAAEALDDAQLCQAIRPLLRGALDRVLEGRELKSRQVMMELRKLT